MVWRKSIGWVFVAVWFLLTGLRLFGVNAPEQLMLVIALVAGVTILFGLFP